MTARITVTNEGARRSVEVLARCGERLGERLGIVPPGESSTFFVWQDRGIIVREARDTAAEGVPTRPFPEISPHQIVPSALAS